MPTRFSRSSARSADAQRLVSSRCPECGAPVDFRALPREQAQVKCAYCGTMIAIPGRTATPPQAPPPTTIVVSSDGQVVKGGWGCSAAIWSIIILVVALAIFGGWSLNMFTTATRVVSSAIEDDSGNDLPGFPAINLPPIEVAIAPKPRLATGPVLLRGDERAATQMVIAAYEEDGSLLIGFDPAQRAETWRSPLFSEEYYEMGVSADASRVYVADGAQLTALDRSSGQTLWQTSLANNIQTGCNVEHPCLQQVGEQTVALARDGTVQGFTSATGAPLWSRRLNSQPRHFIANQDQVILVDNDTSNRAVVLVLTASNGDPIYELQPSCAFPNITMRPHSSDQFMVTPDGSALLVVGSGTYACAWRYSLGDGSLTWSYTSPGSLGPLPFAWSMSSLAVADPVIYFIKEEGELAQIYALDSQLQASTPQPLYSIEDHTLTVLYPIGELLLVSAQPEYARDEVELWAIDRNTGERRWQRKLETTHTFDEWMTRPTVQGLFVAVCYWDTDDCRFEVLDLATGTSQGQVRQAAGRPFSGAAWLGDRGFLTLDGSLYAVDLRTATVEYIWP